MEPSLDESRRIRETNDQVWDMVLNLVNPVFFYVVFQILIISHLGHLPLFRLYEWWIFGAQFLGAWALFYSTMLRDMGYPSRTATVLALLGLAGVVSQYWIFPRGSSPSDRAVGIFLSTQLIPALVLWIVVQIRWIHYKRAWMKTQNAGDDVT